jgi:hypothetical protein
VSPVEPEIKKDDRVIWNDRIGTVMEIDTSAQKTAVGRRYGWPFAAWVLFDDKGRQRRMDLRECVLL